MNLPQAIKELKRDDFKSVVDDHPVSAAQTSNKIGDVADVEYEDDYDNEHLFNGITSMAQQNPTKEDERNNTQEVRDYSINSWNGSPGLTRWGYDDTNLNR